MAAALTASDITETLKRVYAEQRRYLWSPHSYAYYGFWYCQRCQKHLEEHDREPHTMWHALMEAP